MKCKKIHTDNSIEHTAPNRYSPETGPVTSIKILVNGPKLAAPQVAANARNLVEVSVLNNVLPSVSISKANPSDSVR